MPTKNAAPSLNHELRPEYDLAKLTGGVRGKYYEGATAGTTLVLLEPDVAEGFPDAKTVNEALRAILKVARAQVRGSESIGKLPNKPLQPTAGARPAAARRRGSKRTRRG